MKNLMPHSHSNFQKRMGFNYLGDSLPSLTASQSSGLACQADTSPKPVLSKNRSLFCGVMFSVVHFLAAPALALNPPPTQIFYVPFPEDHQLNAMAAINPAAVNPLTVFLTLAASSDGTVVYYDHWEDGYEVDITAPTQSTTLIFGDGNQANGYPPGNPGDFLSAGAVFNLRNFVDIATLQSVLDYDARDKIGSFKPLSASKVSFPAGANTFFAGCVEMFERGLWGNEYRVPVGVDMPTSTAAGALTFDGDNFSYTSVSIMAGEGGSSVQIDKDNNGTFEETVVLAEGESVFRSGLVTGARILGSRPLQVILFTGPIGASYASRDGALLPISRWTNDYYAPASPPAPAANNATVTYIYNPAATAITVSYDYRNSATTYATATVSVPAGGNARVVHGQRNGTNHFGSYRFYTTGATPPLFYAFSCIDANGVANTNWDGGYGLIGKSSLSTQVLVSIGIGRDPYSPTNPNENGNPIWLTTVGNGNTRETVYVDFNGDNTGNLTDPNGNFYDIAYSLRELEEQQILDPDGDQSGALIYTLNANVKIAAVYAQNPTLASGSAPGIDVAAVIPPLREGNAGKRSSLVVDADGDGFISPGDTLEYNIDVTNDARSSVPGPFKIIDDLPADVTYVPGTTRYRFKVANAWQSWIALADASTGTPFPLDAAGFSIPGSINSRQQLQIVFRTGIKTYANLTASKITNAGSAEISPLGITVPLLWSDALYGSMGDLLWNDANANGIQDAGEGGLAGVQIFADLNNNGTREAGEPTSTTNANGNYLLNGLLAGTYTIRVNQANIAAINPGFGPTYDPDGIATSHSAAVTLLAGQDKIDADFGYRSGASVGNRLWLDANGNGVQEAGEPGINGVRVFIDANGNNTYDAGEKNTITSGDGLYYIGNIAPGIYSVCVDATTLPVGAIQTFDLDGTLNNRTSVTLTAVEDRADLDFGYRGTLSLGDLVWEDINNSGTPNTISYNVIDGLIDINRDNLANANDDGLIGTTTIIDGKVDINNSNSITTADDGTFLTKTVIDGSVDFSGNGTVGTEDDGTVVFTQPTPEAGIPNVRVYIDANGNGLFDTNERSALTNSSGIYTLTNLFNGTYTVRVDTTTLPASYFQTYDLTPPLTDHTASVTLTGVSRTDVDFGYRNDASIGDLVWNDRNGDGVRNTGEPGIAGVYVFIDVNANGLFDQGIEPYAVTDLNGSYTLANLSAGTYLVRVEISSLPQLSTPTFDFDGTATAHNATRTLSVSENAVNLDFGYRATANVGNLVWNDANADGIQNGGEPGIANVRIYLDINGNGTFESATEPAALTDANGAWTIDNLVDGIYTARVDPSTLAPGLAPTYDATGATDGIASFSLSSAQTLTTIDFGYTNPVTIGDFVWEDLNGNGQQNVGEPGLAGVAVTVFRSSNNTVAASTVSSGTGAYSFPGLLPASYYLVFGSPAGYQPTVSLSGATATDSNASAVSGTTAAVILTGGQTNNTIDAGYYRFATITGSVLVDIDNNNTGDAGLSGVTLTLKDSAGADIDSDLGTPLVQPTTALTNATGLYTFANLPPGSYRVVQTQPAGYLSISDTDGTNNNMIGDQTPIVLTSNLTSSNHNFVEEQPGTISGHLYVDTNGNGTQNAGEPNLPNIDVLITDSAGGTQTVVTDANGNWTATVTPGSTSANISEADPQFPAGATQSQGTDPTTVTVNPSANSDAGIDGYYVPATLTGHLYIDTNGNGAQNAGEPNLANINVILTTSTGGTITVVTNAAGDWTASVPPGTTSADADNADVDFPAGATQSQGTDPSSVTAVANANTSAGIDGFYIPATITGHLYIDTNGNGAQDSGEPNLAAVNVLITASTGATQIAASDASGNYSASVPPGTTTANVDETDPQFPPGATQTQGTDPTNITAVANASTSIGIDGYYIPGTITGHLYVDTNGNGSQDSGEPNLANINVILTTSTGATVIVATNATGDWTASVPPGTTSANVDNSDVDFPAGATQTQGTDPTSVTAVANASTSAGLDGFYIPATVTGHLFIDTDGNGTQNSGEPNLPNINIILTTSTGATVTVATNANGDWTASVPPGTTSANVDNADVDFPAGAVQSQGTDPTSVTAIANASTSAGLDGFYIPATVTGHLYIDTNGNGIQDAGEPNLAAVNVLITASTGATQTVASDASGNYSVSVPPGTTSANVDETDPQFPAGATQTQGNDPTSITAIANASTSIGIDGYYIAATVTGHLYIDTNGNSTQNAGEPNLANISVILTTSTGSIVTVVTNATGDWTASVPPGTTSANVDNADVDFPAGATQSQGTDPTSVTAVANTSTSAGIDGFFIPATISGHLYIDTNGNGTQDTGEPNLAAVNVVITAGTGATQTVASDASGNYAASVPPGATSSNVDETDPQFPAGATQTQGNDPTSVTAIANASTSIGIDGYYIPATITGHLYIDANGNGTQDPGELNLAAVNVLITASTGATQIVATDANGNWTATVPPGNTSANIDETDPQYPAGANQTQGTDPNSVTAVANASTSAGIDGFYIPATVTGHLYIDTNGNGTQDSGEPDLAAVNVLITASTGATQTVATDANGNWSASVPPGTTSANVDETDPQFPTSATQTQGTDPTSVNAVAGASANGGIDGYYRPATVTGHLYIDTNGNGTQDTGEPNFANIDVIITTSTGATQIAASDASGNYSASVPPGTTTANVDETDPQFPAGATQTQGNDPTSIIAVANASTSIGIDGYYIPGTITGHLYVDTNGNGSQDSGEPNLANINVILTTSTGATVIVATNATGDWTASVPPGTTSANVDNSDVDFPAGATQTQGTDPTSVTAVANASTSAGLDGFYIPATVTGHLFIDTDGNGTQNSGEPNLPNINIILTTSTGATVTVATNANGDWTASVPPGTTSANVDNADVDFPAGAVQSQGTDPTSVTAIANASTSAGLDGFYIPATVTGHLYIDTNGNGIQDAGEPNLAAVNVLITASTGATQTVASDASGNYSVSVPPGTTSANVDETDPQFPAGATQTQGNDPTSITAIANASTSIGIDGYYIAATVTGHLYIDTNGNSTQNAGEPNLANISVILTTSTGSIVTVVTNATGDWTASVPPGTTSANVDNADVDFPAGATQSQGTDPTSVTAVANTSTSAGIDGFFIPATISGHLYIDTNGNGTQDTGEPNLAAVNVVITAGTGATQTVASDASGNYAASVPPGATSSNVDETDPQFPAGATQTQGNDPTSVTAIANASTSIGIDGYYIPATITGHLYIDANGNGTQDPGELNLAAVNVLITASTGATQIVATDANGNWTATVPPGNTSANIDETDPQYPAGANQTQGTDPNSVTAVANASTSAGIDGFYIPATVTGHLYIDTNGNGTQDSGEPDLAAVNVLITASTGATQTVATDANGNWSASVPPGTTSANVDETDPQFPTSATQTQGTDPTSVNAVAGASANGGIDGYYRPATVTGHLYIDTNGNGTQDTGEPNFANIDVIITTSTGATVTVTTNSAGNYTASVPPGSTSFNVDNADADFPVGATQTEGTDPTVITAVAAASTTAGIDGYQILGTVTGHLYTDVNGNGTQNPGEPALADVDVLITDSLGGTRTVTTNSNGDWSANIPPGAGSANINEADPQYPAGSTLTQGSDPTNFTAAAGTTVNGGTDGFYYPTSVSGQVYLDRNGNGIKDTGETGLPGIDIVITTSIGTNLTVTTDNNGLWVASVPPGSTTIDVKQADPDFPPTAVQTQGSDPTTVIALVGSTNNGGTDGFYVPAILTGHLYLDTNGNGTQNAGEPNLAAVNILITTSNNATFTVATNAGGDWTASVPPGATIANVDETDPQYPSGANQTQGTDPTTITAVAGTSTAGGVDGYFIPATVTGHLYLDTNGNGSQDLGEPNLSGIDLAIIDSNGANQTVVTNASGDWSASVPPGTTTADVRETSPQFPANASQTQGNDPTTLTAISGTSTSAGIDGYYVAATVTGHLYSDTNGNGTQDSGESNLDNVNVVITNSNGSSQTVVTNASGNYTASVPPGATTANVDETDPQLPAGSIRTEGTDPTTITAIAGASTSAGIDGYYLPATLTGHLYLDTNGNGNQDSGEPDLAAVNVFITASTGATQTVNTDASGNWTAAVPPGATIANVDETDPQYPGGTAQTQGNDPTTTTAIAGASINGGTDGYYRAATVTGHLYLDTNGNGSQDAGEPDLAAVNVFITSSTGVTQTVASDANGNYSASVPPGLTTVDVDESDPQYPAGTTRTEGTDPASLTATAGASESFRNHGYYRSATLTGHLYLDTNGNGSQDSGEPNLPAVNLLITSSTGATQTVTTDASGNWSVSVPPGSTIANVDETDPQFPAGSLQTQGTDPTTTTAVAGMSTSGGLDGYYFPAALTGHLYGDTNGNGSEDAGEPNLAAISLLITDSNGATQTAVTDASGNWSVSVPPGSTVVNVDETDPQFPAGSTQTQGTDPRTVTAVANTTTAAGNNGYYLPATVTGHLYLDTNGNGTQDSGEPPLPNINVLITASNGSTQTIATNALGHYSASVPPGSTTSNVDETDPQYPAGTNQTEGMDPASFTAIAGTSTAAGNNGYYRPAILRGHLYLDSNGNGSQDSGEPNLPGIDVILTDSGNALLTVITNGTGDWTASVPPGSTSINVDESDPQFPAGTIQTQGTDPKVVTAIAGAATVGGLNGYYLPATVTGNLYLDTNGNGTQDAGEPGLAAVNVLITASNNTFETVVTDTLGHWTAAVPPGSTNVNVDEADPQYPTGTTQTQGVDPASITAIAGSSTSTFPNGYYRPAIITGHLYVDTNGDGVQNAAEPNLSGIDVLVTDSLGNTRTVATNASGNWSASVPPGSTSANVQETDPQFPAGAAQTEGTDPTTVIAVAGASTATDLDGYYIPATVSGHLYLDANGDGTRNPGELNLANVNVRITNSNGILQITATNASGNWTVMVPPGSTLINVDSTDPQYPAGSIQSEGTDPRTLNAVANATTSAGSNGYYTPATLTGHVYLDTNGNGFQDSGEPDLAGAAILITEFNGDTQTSYTDTNGDWTASVTPGTTLSRVDPAGATYPNGAVLTQGVSPASTNAIAGATVNAGTTGFYIPATITGHLYIDTNGNGTQDPGEPNLSNVNVLIVDSNGAARTLVSDANGNYTATVPPGSTTVTVDTTDPDYPVGASQTEGTNPTSLTALANASTAAGNAGFVIRGTITGHLYTDVNGNGLQNPGEPNLAGVNLLITDSSAVVFIVTTNVSGNWTANVLPGSVIADVDETDPQFPAGSAQTDGTDPTTVTVTAGSSVSAGNDGYYYATSITGLLYSDTNGNGIRDAGEPGLGNIDVLITDSNSNIQTVTTDGNGAWIVSVPPGSTTVDVQESDPNFSAAYLQTQGTDPNIVVATLGASTNGGTNGYFTPANVTGHLYRDTNGNGTQDPGELNLPGIDVLLTASNGTTQIVTTDASGNYTATVPPGLTTANVDESDADYPGGTIQTQGADPATLTAVAGTSTATVNNGYYRSATVTGHLYTDVNGNGTQDATEPNLAGIDIVIIDSLGNAQTVATNAFGNYTASVPPGSTTVDAQESDPQFPSNATQTEGTDPATVTTAAGVTTNLGNKGYYTPATISGHLYADSNSNGTQDLGEPNLPGINVLITASNGSNRTVTTDALGTYTASVPPGPTTSNVDETDPQFPAGAIQTEGTDPTTVTAVANTTTSAGNNGYFTAAIITGRLYQDTNGNGTQDPGEPGLSGIDVVITNSMGQTRTVTTNGTGNYSASVTPGSTLVDIDQTDPQYPAGATQTQGTDPVTLTAIAGAATSAGTNGYYTPATLTGHLYIDTNGNGIQDSGEPNLASVTVLITDSLGNALTVSSNSLGNYTASVPPGSTTVDIDESDPQFPGASTQTQGIDPVTLTAIAGSSLSAGTNGYYKAATVTGHLYADTNGNGIQDSGEPNLGGIDIHVTASTGAIQTVTTNAAGHYAATVPPGSTVVDVDATDPQMPAGAIVTQGADPTTITALAGTSVSTTAIGYFTPAIVTGHLYSDTNGNGTQNSGEPGLPGIDVRITDSMGQTQTVTTDSNGSYSATVPPGTTTADVDETDPSYPAGTTQTQGSDPAVSNATAGNFVTTTPRGYYLPSFITGLIYQDTNGNGTRDPGEPALPNVNVTITTVTGATLVVSSNASGNWTATVPPGSTTVDIDESDPQFPVGAVLTEGADPNNVTTTAGNITLTGRTGFYLSATLTGHLYADTNGDGTQDPGEPNLSGINVLITNSNSSSQTVTTDAGGNWTAMVPPGSTTIDIDETDPQYPTGAVQTEGTNLLTVTAVAAATVNAPPSGYFTPAILSGHLYADTNGNGTQDSGEPGLAGIDVVITTVTGSTFTVTTNASGDWTASVPPGATSANVDETDAQFPTGSIRTQGTDPSTTTAVAGTITSAGSHGYYLPATVSGHLYTDVNGNGTQDGSEPDLANVDILITDSLGNTQTVATSSAGNWTTTVPPGSTTITVKVADPDLPTGSLATEGTTTTTITAAASTPKATVNGYFLPGTLTGLVRADTNGDKIPDALLANVIITLRDASTATAVDSDPLTPGTQSTTLTGANGRFTFNRLPPGSYQITQSQPTGYRSVSDSDGSNNNSIGDETPIQITAGNTSTGHEFIEKTYTCPDTWAEWLVQNPGQTADGNPDGDSLDNLAEFAFSQPHNSGTGNAWQILPSTTIPGALDAVLTRPFGATLNVTYLLQYASAPGSPTPWNTLPITPAIYRVDATGDCTETIRLPDLESITGLTAGSGIVRIQVELDADNDGIIDHTSYTESEGWKETAFGLCCTTFANPFLRNAVFTGKVTALNGQTLDLGASTGTANLATLLASGIYYVEVTAGDHEGQRYDITSATSNAVTLASDSNLFALTGPYNTTLGAPPATLAGDSIAIRRHWSLAETFPPASHGATADRTTADQVQLFANGTWSIYWLYTDGINPARWVVTGDNSYAGQDNLILPPGQGLFFNNRTALLSTLTYGEIRENDFLRPLAPGSNLVAAGYPVDQSPTGLRGRQMTKAAGFFGSRDTATADSVYVWQRDALPASASVTTSAYDSYFLNDNGRLPVPTVKWVKIGDATLLDRGAETLFPGNRSAFHRSKNGLNGYLIPTPWNP